MGIRKSLLASLFLLHAAACSVGPDHEAPEPEMPTEFDAAEAVDVASGGPENDAWWESFEDPVLTRCVEEALVSNHDLLVSFQRVRIARALRRAESSAYLPQVGTHASYSVDRISENNPRFQDAVQAGLFPRDVDYWDVGFDVSWELDVFGGTRRRVEGASALIEGEEFQRRALMLTVAAEVVRNYLEILGHQNRLKLMEEQVVLEGDRIAILDEKRTRGMIPASSVLQSRARREQIRALVPPVEAEIRAGKYRLAVLMGRRPQESIAGLDDVRQLPSTLGRVPTGLPSDLLRRRPDMLAAERRIASATADVGVAVSEFFPRFFLTGSPHVQSGDFSNLFSGPSSAWIFGPSISWKIFSGGRNKAQLEAARAQREQAFIEYESVLNHVLEEVESSLIRYGKGAQSLGYLSESLSFQEKSLSIQTTRHESGIVDRLEVLDARAAWIEARKSQLDQEVSLLTRMVTLYKALGGGWKSAEQLVSSSAVSEEE